MPEWMVILCMLWAGFAGYVWGKYGWRAFNFWPRNHPFVAKPVQGEINFKALRRNIMGRFRKTIAYLAK